MDAQGVAFGANFQINSFTSGSQSQPDLVVRDDGLVFAAWQSAASPGDDASGNSIVGRLLQLPGELGDFVFQDDDLDGAQDPGEPGLEGLTVSLYDASGELATQTATDADGLYRFYLAESAEISLGFESPDGVSFTRADAADDALDSDVDPATGEIPLFQASLGVTDTTLDAGLGAGLGDRVWLDGDGNGIQDIGEAGVAGVTVTLYDGGGAVVDQTVTDGDGRYVFFGLDSGAYSVGVSAPAGFTFTSRDQGDDGLDSDVNASGRSSPVLFLEGSIDVDIDAGRVAAAPGAGGARGGRVRESTPLNTRHP
ncbi:MAG: SdrD B-like domain-containing protein, partial [Acidobacteriota bacterium]